jgi:excisionase family DNA binding protein
VDDMPFRMETRPIGQPHPDDVDDIVRSIKSWSRVTPDQRVALRSAVAGLKVTEFVPAVPIERPMRVAEVASALRVSRQKVRDMIRTGDLPAYRLSGSPRAEFRVPESAVRDFLSRAS